MGLIGTMIVTVNEDVLKPIVNAQPVRDKLIDKKNELSEAETKSKKANGSFAKQWILGFIAMMIVAPKISAWGETYDKYPFMPYVVIAVCLAIIYLIFGSPIQWIVRKIKCSSRKKKARAEINRLINDSAFDWIPQKFRNADKLISFFDGVKKDILLGLDNAKCVNPESADVVISELADAIYYYVCEKERQDEIDREHAAKVKAERDAEAEKYFDKEERFAMMFGTSFDVDQVRRSRDDYYRKG